MDALQTLGPLLGTGGLAAIVVAWLGYLRAAREGGKPSLKPESVVGITSFFADQTLIKRIADSIDANTTTQHEANKCQQAQTKAIDELNRNLERVIDVMIMSERRR
jgi:hypothetical protein